jgi:hypothetical protein
VSEKAVSMAVLRPWGNRKVCDGRTSIYPQNGGCPFQANAVIRKMSRRAGKGPTSVTKEGNRDVPEGVGKRLQLVILVTGPRHCPAAHDVVSAYSSAMSMLSLNPASWVAHEILGLGKRFQRCEIGRDGQI